MNILLVASEVTPFAKTGGLADVAGALPQALAHLGHDVRICMPYYRSISEKPFVTKRLEVTVEVEIAGALRSVGIYLGRLGEVPVYFLDYPEFFQRQGLYGTAAGDYPDNAQRFGLFCRAVLEALPQLDFRPDVLHLNDWQTGLIPVLLHSERAADPFYTRTGTVMTIHNLGYQGLFPPEALTEIGLDPGLFHMEGLEYYGQLSFLKGGLFFSDLVTTVSPSYCREIQTPEFGHGFEGILHKRRKELIGILNGIDCQQWNPATDAALHTPYSAENPKAKIQNKLDLQHRLGLARDSHLPIVAMVTRLATQKGLDILEAAWPQLIRRPLQFVLLGDGEEKHMAFFRRLQDKHPELVSITLSFDDSLARRIYAGSDLFLMPSHYEPCGLGQLIALRYGAIPLVRRTGGLADTVSDVDKNPLGNGFVFTAPTAKALIKTLNRALKRYHDHDDWACLVQRAMAEDFSWEQSAGRYVEIYQRAQECKGE
ncbi:starch synthase [Syntrophotalea acetylenivorans]|uniref:Glycogen synthase n=1 Tax=Syntrophotalea acetylenivorans TaxID=1842532 RepID=A0A1L3GRK7_9BACT|nr:glycogen synthase GlgA [Syntrophotalea acetylenivorans]APG28581.1 starch synthase [Syntrophotalea acetylenivorans]